MTDAAETNTAEMLTRLEGADMSLWSESKRLDFCKTFAERVAATRCILIGTAERVHELALRRHFVSAKHTKAIFNGLLSEDKYKDHWTDRAQYHGYGYRNLLGEAVSQRSESSLNLIAEQRAKEIVSHLPSLSKAVRIIDIAIAKKIDRRDKLQEDGEVMRQQLEEVCGVIDMADLDQNMTIGAFREMVEARDKKRLGLIDKLNKVTEEGQKLEEDIAKALYAGLPGLSEAVVAVIRNHLEQAIALEATSRRVEEKVKFGDCEAAVTLLRRFEADEVEVSDKVKEQFQAALGALKLTGAKKAPKRIKKAA